MPLRRSKLVETLFAKHNLNISNLHGQGYNGASNLYEQFNGVKDLILKENKSAFSVHCFARELQLALVSVTREQRNVNMLFQHISYLLKIVGASCNHKDVIG